MSYPPYSSSHYSPPSHASSLSSSSGSSYGSSGRRSSYARRLADNASIDSSVAARYEAAKSFDLEDDLEFCPSLTIDEVRQYYDDITAKSMFFPMYHQQLSPPSQPTTPSPPNTFIHPSPPHYNHTRLAVGDAGQGAPIFRPPSRGRGTAAIKIIDPSTREERRRQYF